MQTEREVPRKSTQYGERRCPSGCGVLDATFALPGYGIGRCAGCGLYALERLPGTPVGSEYDRTQFDGALADLRRRNYHRVLERIAALRPLRGCRLLDVGCSSGWFLAAAAARGCLAFGIEPDEFFARQADRDPAAGVRVQRGKFPDDLPAEWGSFDVITFNDVFEHLDEPVALLQAVKARLSAGGVVVLALPMAGGFVFRLGCLLYRLGLTKPLERIFQVHYPYPHLYYYGPASLTALAERAGFEAVSFDRLRSFAVRGSLHRARMDRSATLSGRLRQYASALALTTFAILEPLVPADSGLAILRPRLA